MTDDKCVSENSEWQEVRLGLEVDRDWVKGKATGLTNSTSALFL